MKTQNSPTSVVPSLQVALLALLAAFGFGGPTAAVTDAEGWIVVESENLSLYSDAPPSRAVEIAENLERFRTVFARLAPALELRASTPTALYAFRDAESFAPYKTRPDRGGVVTLGQFLSHPDGNYLTLDAGSRLAGAYAVIYHEYVHYLVSQNFPGVPLWFNEGLAEYYSTFAVEQGRAVVGRPVQRHVRWLRGIGDFPLADLLTATTGSAAYHEPDQVGGFYASSWLLVHYLLSGGDDRLERCADFLIRVVEGGEDVEEAFEGAFGRRISAMEQELQNYAYDDRFAVASVRLDDLRVTPVRVGRLPVADTLFHLGDLLARQGRLPQAEGLFQAALERSPRHAEAHGGLAYVRDRQDRWEEAEVLYRDALAMGSRRAITHLLYGRHSLRLTGTSKRAVAAEARARKVLARAVALEPSYGEAHANLAVAHLRPGGDPDAAMKAVRKARDLMPARLDLVALQVQVHLRREEVDAAEGLILRELDGRASIEVVDRAFEDVDRTRLVVAAQRALEQGDGERAIQLFDEAVSLTSDEALRQRMEQQLLNLQEQVGG